MEIYCPACSKGSKKIKSCTKEPFLFKCKNCKMFFFNRDKNITLSNKCTNCLNKCTDNESCMNLNGLDEFISRKTKIAEKNISYIQKNLKKDLSEIAVLEIGSGFGELGNILSIRCNKYDGIEQSENLYAMMKKLYPDLSKKILFSTLKPDIFKKDFYDLIIIKDVLQFISSLDDFLKTAKLFLKKDGIIYIEVPNESNFYFKHYLLKKSHLYCNLDKNPGHINFFNEKSLKYLLIKNNFKIQKIEKISILGDINRIEATLKRKYSLIQYFLSYLLRFSKIDLLLNLCNYSCFAGKHYD